MASDWISAFISAASGLSGVWLGSWLTNRREESREKTRLKTEAVYAAILVVSHLDRLIDNCLELAWDDGTIEGRPSGSDGYTHEATVDPPKFCPIELDVQWKCFPHDLMYMILNLPYKLEMLEKRVQESFEFSYDMPEYTDSFWTRRSGYAELGLEVSEIAFQLRRNAGLPINSTTRGGMSREEQLRTQKAEVEQARATYLKRVNETLAGKSCV